jgi:hypothetical protein
LTFNGFQDRRNRPLCHLSGRKISAYHNLEVIHDEPVSSNYCFKTKCKYNFEHPLLEPLPDTENFLMRLDASVKRIGYVPLSLKLFYKIVGACNFTWDYDAKGIFPGKVPTLFSSAN